MLIFLMCFLVQADGYYYLDGTTFHLDNGTRIKTVEKITEDKYFYFWYEENTYVSIEKKRVRSISYFAMRVKGKAPNTPSRTSIQRRIQGSSIVYLRDGETYLKCRHVDERGRSAETTGAPNFVREIRRLPGEEILLEARFVTYQPGYTVKFKFYDQRGRLLCTSFVDMNQALLKKPRKEKVLRHKIVMPAGLVKLEKLGLIEVVSVRTPI